MKKLHRFTTIVAAATLLIVVPTTAASATTATEDPTGSYCAVQLHTIQSGAENSDPVCFATDTALQSYLGSVGVKQASTSTVKTRSLAAAATTSGSAVLLGEVFQDVYYAGAKMAFWGQDGCQDGATYGWPTLPAAWSNSISSGHGNDTCYLQMYPLQNYMDDGMKITCSWECITMSTMNDRAQSLKFTPYGVFG